MHVKYMQHRSAAAQCNAKHRIPCECTVVGGEPIRILPISLASENDNPLAIMRRYLRVILRLAAVAQPGSDLGRTQQLNISHLAQRVPVALRVEQV